jgi:hypothetical protein
MSEETGKYLESFLDKLKKLKGNWQNISPGSKEWLSLDKDWCLLKKLLTEKQFNAKKN